RACSHGARPIRPAPHGFLWRCFADEPDRFYRYLYRPGTPGPKLRSSTNPRGPPHGSRYRCLASATDRTDPDDAVLAIPAGLSVWPDRAAGTRAVPDDVPVFRAAFRSRLFPRLDERRAAGALGLRIG